MRSFNSIIFVLFFVFYGILCIFQFLSGSVFEGALASRENSVQMYLYIVVFIITIMGILPHIGNLKQQDNMFYLVLVFLLYYAFATLFSSLYSNINDIKYIGNGIVMSSISPLAFIYFYYCAKDSNISIQNCLTGFLALLAIETYAVLHLYAFSYMHSNSVVIMQFYTLFFILPWLLCLRKNALVIFIFFLFAILTAYSSKRGAFLTLFGSVIIFYALRSYVKNKNVAVVLLYPVVIIVPLLLTMLYFIDFSFIFERLGTISTDRGSGRLDIYQLLWDVFRKSDIIAQIFGNGGGYGTRNVTMQIEMFGAHNDYLQVLLDIGILGLILLLTMIFTLVKRFLFLMKSMSFVAPAFGVSMVFVLILSSISSVFCANFTTVPIWSFWGYIIGAMSANNYNNFLIYPPQDGNFLWQR